MKDSGIRAPLPAILRQVEIFQALGEEEREALASRMERRRYRGGEAVFREGDASDGLYVVHSGEVGVVAEGGPERRVLARLGPGQCFGEMSLLTGEPRSTSVYATLDTEVLFLRDSAFEALLRRFPAVALAIGRTLSLRLRRANLSPREDLRARIIVCRAATTRLTARALAEGLARHLAACRGVEVLLLGLGRSPGSTPAPRGIDDLHRALRAGEGADLAAYTAPLAPDVRVLDLGGAASPPSPRLLGPLFSLAVSQLGGTVVSGDADPGAGPEDPAGPFADEALRQCDLAIVATDASEAGVEGARVLMGGAAGSLPAEKRRVVLVREGTPPPGTVQVVEERLGVPVAAQLALDPGPPPRLREDDLARLARRLSHAAVGLALGGGGARGLAHIGILEVLRREKVPVDVVGGTSIGSIIAALHVVGHAPDAIREIVRREWVERNPLNDFTLPKVAFVRGRRGEKVLRRVFGDVRIEDLPTPYFAVAADLVAAEEVVLSRGPLWLAVRASGSIPVLLTPVKADGRFLVDGGVINNVPGDHLARFGADVSIAVDVSPRREAYFESLLARPGRVGLLGRIARRSGLLREWLDYPGIIRTLRRVIAIEGLEIMKTKSAAFDVCIQPDVEGFDLLDFGKIDRLVEAGREAALKALPAIRVGVGAAAARRGPGGRTAS
jgi:predicted acylesterase/phospholipase RssA/CRP-like cAMP-binding protein